MGVNVGVGARVGSGVGVAVGSAVGVTVGSGVAVTVGRGVFVGRGVGVSAGFGVGVAGSDVTAGRSEPGESSGSSSDPQAMLRSRTRIRAMVPAVHSTEGRVRIDPISYSLT